MNVHFACPNCEALARASLDQAGEWQCPACGHRLPFEKATADLTSCAVCGCHELYKQKDFPHRLGLTVLVGAFGLSVLTYLWYEKWLTWALLIGSAVFDGLLFWWVGDAVICYRCHAYHQGFVAADRHQPFELTIGERYRQERLRREQMRNRQESK